MTVSGKTPGATFSPRVPRIVLMGLANIWWPYLSTKYQNTYINVARPTSKYVKTNKVMVCISDKNNQEG